MVGSMTILVAPFPVGLAALVTLFHQPPIVLATYSAGIVILILGFIRAFRVDIPRARGLDRAVCLGPVLYAAPLAVFSAEHFTATRNIASLVPGWIPWHIFWALFVGVALISAALSFAVHRVTGLAAALLGIMFFLFVVLMDVEGLARHLHNRFAQALTLRELTFSACAFGLAATLVNDRWRSAAVRIAVVARCVVGFAFVFYGVEHFLHPGYAPVIPLELQLPAYIPFRWLWAYGLGALEVAGGLAMLANWHARTAATSLGIAACFVTLVVYGPILAVHPADVDVALNYFADTLCFGGAVLCLAASIPPAYRARLAVAIPAASSTASV